MLGPALESCKENITSRTSSSASSVESRVMSVLHMLGTRGLVPLFTLLSLLLLTAGDATAQEGGLLLQLDTEYERTKDTNVVSGLRDVQTVGLSIDANGRMGQGHVAHSAFIDAHFGAGLQGGFAYRFALLPIGLALYDKSQHIILSAAGGLMIHGVTAHQPFGVVTPLRISLIARIGDHVLLNAWASNDIALGNERQNNPEHALFGDELRSGVVLRAGRSGKVRGGRQVVTHGSGYFLGVLFSERLGTQFWGLTIGHGMNMRGTSGRRNRAVPSQRGR